MQKARGSACSLFASTLLRMSARTRWRGMCTATGGSERGSGAMSRVERRRAVEKKIAAPQTTASISAEKRYRSLPANEVHRTVRDALKEGEVIFAFKEYCRLEQLGALPLRETTEALFFHPSNTVQMTLRLLQDLTAYGDDLDKSFFNRALANCAKVGTPHACLEVLDVMRASNVDPGPFAFASLIKAYGFAQQQDEAMRYYEQCRRQFYTHYRERMHRPDVKVYASAINTCAEEYGSYRAEKAMDILNDYVTDANNYEISMETNDDKEEEEEEDEYDDDDEDEDLVVDEKEADKDESARRLNSDGLQHVRPFNTILGLLVRHQDADRVERVFDLLQSSGIRPNFSTFDIMIRYFCERSTDLFHRAAEFESEHASSFLVGKRKEGSVADVVEEDDSGTDRSRRQDTSLHPILRHRMNLGAQTLQSLDESSATVAKDTAVSGDEPPAMSKTKKMLDTREEGAKCARRAIAFFENMLEAGVPPTKPICELIRMVAITVEDVDAVELVTETLEMVDELENEMDSWNEGDSRG